MSSEVFGYIVKVNESFKAGNLIECCILSVHE